MEIHMPDCSECDKLIKVAPESQKLGEFMDWLGVSGYVICTLEESDDDSGKEYFRSTYKNVETILAEYFGIDLKKVEQEQRALLCAIRAQGSSSANKVP